MDTGKVQQRLRMAKANFSGELCSNSHFVPSNLIFIFTHTAGTHIPQNSFNGHYCTLQDLQL